MGSASHVSHFLWWYWLGLVAMLGLPMLVAIWIGLWYRQRGKTPRMVRVIAGRIFWWLAFCMMALCPFAIIWLLPISPPPPWHASTLYAELYVTTWIFLLLEFFTCFLIANWALRRRDRSRGFGIRIACGLAIWAWAQPLSWLVHPLLALGLLHSHVFSGHFIVRAMLGFAACLIAAWGWRGFLQRPSARAGRRALALLVLSALLYQGAARHGNTMHLYLHKIARGELPSETDLRDYLMK